VERLRPLRLDADDAHAVAERRSDAGDEAPAADGDEDDVRVGCVLLDLEPDGARTGDHDGVVEGVHERPPRLLPQLGEALERLRG
jgi:hypothetical protein